jgi:hypothetical protein
MTEKKNCWEVKNCGRQLGGKKVKELGICPASMEARLDGIHNGKNAGRSCWVVAGTLCGGAEQGTFAKKFHSCETCEFYETVKKEEFPSFKFSSTLLARIKQVS